MKLFKDILCQEEFFTDAKKIEENWEGLPKELVGLLVRVSINQIVVSNSIDDSAIGGNASAEGEDACDAAEDTAVKGCDVVLSHHLKEVTCFRDEGGSAKSQVKKFTADYFKRFCKKLDAKLKELGLTETAEDFRAKAPKLLAFIKEKWDDIAIFSSEGGGDYPSPVTMEDHSFCFMTYDDATGLGNYMYFIKHCLEEEKV